MTPLSKQYVMHCRDATYSRKITLIIFHRIIAWKKTTRLNTIPVMFVMLRYCWLQIYSYFDQGCRKKCTRQSRKGIVGGFEGTSCPSKKFERMVQEATDICLRILKESNKSRFDSFSRFEQCIDHIPYFLSGLSHAHFLRQLSRNSCIHVHSVYHSLCMA